jgi:hypothetical protein
MSHFRGGYGQMAPPPPTPPRRGDSESSRPFLIFLLIIACVGVGALLAWGIKEHSERTRLSQRNLEVEKSYVIVLAKRSDLASFLTDRRTKLFHLNGLGEDRGKFATVAWQEETRTGILIADKVAPLPEHEIYAMWHVAADRKPALCGGFQPDPTGTIYDFRCIDPSQGTSGFLISIEPDANAKKPSQIVYETR